MGGPRYIVEPDPMPDDYRRTDTPANVVRRMIAETADEHGIAPVARLVERLTATGCSVRSAHGTLEMLAPGRIAVIHGAPVSPDLEPIIAGRPWTHTRIVPEEERAAALATLRASVAARERRRAARKRAAEAA